MGTQVLYMLYIQYLKKHFIIESELCMFMSQDNEFLAILKPYGFEGYG